MGCRKGDVVCVATAAEKHMEAHPYRLRLAGPEDDRVVGELLVSSFVQQYAQKMPHVVVSEARKAQLRAVSTKRAQGRVWVLEYAGEIVGTVTAWPFGAPGSEAWVHGAVDVRHLAVQAPHRGKGAAGLLVGAVEAWAKSSGAAAVCLHVRRGAEGVRKLYQRRGYVRCPEGDLDFLPEVFLEAFMLPLR